MLKGRAILHKGMKNLGQSSLLNTSINLSSAKFFYASSSDIVELFLIPYKLALSKLFLNLVIGRFLTEFLYYYIAWLILGAMSH
jgi:hypothetical protein